MAALRVQSLAAVGSSSHGASVVCKKGIAVKSARAANNCTLSLIVKKNRLSVGQKQTSSKSNRVRFNCRGSNFTSESGAIPESVDFIDIILDSSDLAVSKSLPKKTLKRNGNEPTARPPKFTTLRPFGEGGEGVMNGLEGSLFQLLASNIQATADIKSWETLTGRIAMLAFVVAVGFEVTTGKGVFEGLDVKGLGVFAALSGLATLTAAGFAFVWRSRVDVANGAFKLVDAAVTDVIEGLFFDDEDKFED